MFVRALGGNLSLSDELLAIDSLAAVTAARLPLKHRFYEELAHAKRWKLDPSNAYPVRKIIRAAGRDTGDLKRMFSCDELTSFANGSTFILVAFLGAFDVSRLLRQRCTINLLLFCCRLGKTLFRGYSRIKIANYEVFLSVISNRYEEC